jgi:hypothetical protein
MKRSNSVRMKVLVGLMMIFLPNVAVAECRGYSGPGGPCYSGPGGGLYSGPGGGLYSGPGGGLYSGPGVCIQDQAGRSIQALAEDCIPAQAGASTPDHRVAREAIRARGVRA